MKMKNLLISFLILMALLVSPVVAEEFVNSQQLIMPYILDGFTSYDSGTEDIIISDARVYIKNLRTDYVTYTQSNGEGYFMFSLNNLLVKNSWEAPYQFGDEIEVYMTTENKYKFQIGGRNLCESNNGIDCGVLAPASGGYVINFAIKPYEYFYYEPEDKEITGENWYNKYKSEVYVIGGIIAILCAAMYALFLYDRSKYKWMPGMVGILKWRLREWVKAYNDTENYTDEEVEKLKKTLWKTADTITRKYINQVEDGKIEPGV